MVDRRGDEIEEQIHDPKRLMCGAPLTEIGSEHKCVVTFVITPRGKSPRNPSSQKLISSISKLFTSYVL